MRYFSNLPLVDYAGSPSRNIVARAGVGAKIIHRYGVFYPYVVRENERADTIAYDYYGDSDFMWLVLSSNGMLDPWNDWHLDQADFYAYLESKYGSIETAQGTTHHWKNTTTGKTMTVESHSLLSPPDKIGFDYEVSCEEWENELNEAKRSIRLLSKKYSAQAAAELERVMSRDRS